MADRRHRRRIGVHRTRRDHRLTTTFEQLDFLYVPSTDVAADAKWFTDVLGARLVFAVEGMGTRVAMIELTAAAPKVLLAGHLDGEAPVLVYRVADLDAAVAELAGRGFDEGTSLEIPYGPVHSFRAPGGQRIALYELTRPDVEAHFEGRFDF
jgi:catechol 2,3-dioxygenase-like lactoylglutathione lyase family enzyme